MRALIQRVTSASVKVDGEIVGKIGKGFLVFLGIYEEDTEEKIGKLTKKIINLRIFNDENDKMNLSIKDVKGEILLISQFTLCADTRKEIGLHLFQQKIHMMQKRYMKKL